MPTNMPSVVSVCVTGAARLSPVRRVCHRCVACAVFVDRWCWACILSGTRTVTLTHLPTMNSSRFGDTSPPSAPARDITIRQVTQAQHEIPEVKRGLCNFVKCRYLVLLWTASVLCDTSSWIEILCVVFLSSHTHYRNFSINWDEY